MTTDDPLLDRATIETAFTRLGERLAARGVVADLYVFGGAAMALAYDARRCQRTKGFRPPRIAGRRRFAGASSRHESARRTSS